MIQGETNSLKEQNRKLRKRHTPHIYESSKYNIDGDGN